MPVEPNLSSKSAVVLAAGSSRRLGQPKQLLEYRGSTLLDVTLSNVRSFGFDQVIVALGGAASQVREQVDLAGCDIVDSVDYTDGCSSSIVSALSAIDPDSAGFLLFLGDQPHVDREAVESLLVASQPDVDMAVVEYLDGPGHPFWFARSMFGALSELHGDKAVWKLLESGKFKVGRARVERPTPLDVDTWRDYQALLDLGV